MNESDCKLLAATWIRLQQAERRSAERDELFWSFDALWELCRNDPEMAWRVIVDIYRNRPAERVLANLAAGPIEDLLVHHGDLALPWIEDCCANEPGFAKVLDMVWKNSMPDKVWDRLRRLIARYG
jgi:hypothetical protein